jgi:NAD(P)H-hydrate epimerase
MEKIVSVQEMLAIEREADATGLTYDQMMENAGIGLAEEILATYNNIKNKSILGLVGSGNNGGDALVALEFLTQRGWHTGAYIVRKRAGDDPLVNRYKNVGGEIYFGIEDTDWIILSSLVRGYSILLDGVLGTGIKLPLKNSVSDALQAVKDIIDFDEHKSIVVAVDCPSGVDSDTGEVASEAIPANITVTMAAVKSGLLKFPAAGYIGELRIARIGNVDNLSSWKRNTRFLADSTEVRGILPARGLNSHKGTYGTALIIAGSVNYTGAVILAGEAAYRIGAGLVSIATPRPVYTILAGHIPEAIWLPLPEDKGVIGHGSVDVIKNGMERATAVLIGPGFGLSEQTKDFLKEFFLECQDMIDDLPLVVDADGLKLLTQLKNWQRLLPPLSILTPHPGEMAVLTGLSVNEIQRDRINIAEKFAREWEKIVVLKGAHTVIASPDGLTDVIPVATSALAKAGTGDVLAGLIVGLSAQGVDAFHAAVAGAWIHGKAGLKAAEALGSEMTVTATDLLKLVPDVIGETI